MVKISVLMGVYNGSSYLKDAMDSILNQTYDDFELIICDDGSTDESVKLVEKYQDNDNRIILIKNKSNLGLAASLNKCLSIAKGDYIARMDSDDIAKINRFDLQLKFFNNHPRIDIVGGAVEVFDNNGINGVRRVMEEYNNINVFKNNYFLHPTVMVRKEALLSVGGYTVSPLTYRTEDYDLWCKLCYEGYSGYNLDDILLEYREDIDSYKKRKLKYRIDAYKIRKYWFEKLDVPKKYKFYIYKPLVVGLIPSRLMRKYHKYKAR